jgi:biotin-dependent carboxylase-like uncharacterized protein
MSTGLLVVHPGSYTTVQDPGRAGYREWGVPPGGSFDRGSAALANALVGNPADAAVLELTLLGGEYVAQVPLALALAGAPCTAVVKPPGRVPRPLVPPQSFTLMPDDRLVLGSPATGLRLYLAVRGGWKTPLLLGSRSREDRIRRDDVLAADPGTIPARRPIDPWWRWRAPNETAIRVLDGPDRAEAVDFDAWVAGGFRVGGEVSRMGIRLEGPELRLRTSPGRDSAPVAPGAVQVAGGQAILLGVACGTTGGYPHVAHVISADLDRLGQLGPGTSIALQRVSRDEARRVDRADREERARRLLGLSAMARDNPPAPPTSRRD